jgi:hypothetical protein
MVKKRLINNVRERAWNKVSARGGLLELCAYLPTPLVGKAYVLLIPRPRHLMSIRTPT